MDLATYSTQGKIRPDNQDTAAYYKKAGGEFIAVLCDGMGGHEGGKIASETATNLIVEEYKIAPDFRDVPKIEIQEWFKKITDDIIKLYGLTIEDDNHYEDMGTTLCVAIGVGKDIYIANIGDSRAYVLYNNKLNQITEDHTVANQLFNNGKINRKELKEHPYRNILYNVFGYQKDYLIDWYSVELVPGTKLILMSDGIYSEIPENEIIKIIANSNSIESATVGICEAADLNGGRDNSTIIIGEF